MLRFDRHKLFRFAALQSPVGRALLVRCRRQPDDISTIVLAFADRALIKSEAVLSIGALLRGPFGVFSLLAALALLFPLRLRDAVYDTVAGNRYSVFGRTTSCRLSDAKHTERFLA